jgi:hypothetical protein
MAIDAARCREDEPHSPPGAQPGPPRPSPTAPPRRRSTPGPASHHVWGSPRPRRSVAVSREPPPPSPVGIGCGGVGAGLAGAAQIRIHVRPRGGELATGWPQPPSAPPAPASTPLPADPGSPPNPRGDVASCYRWSDRSLLVPPGRPPTPRPVIPVPTTTHHSPPATDPTNVTRERTGSKGTTRPDESHAGIVHETFDAAVSDR